ncbi:hypothetical protein D9M71_291520 [compost metagenome]
MLGVRDFAQGRTAVSQDFAHFTGTQTHGYVCTFTSDQLGGCASGASDLSAFTRLQLDTVNGATYRNVAQRHAVTSLDRRTNTGDQLIASSNAFRGDDVATLAVGIFQQSDVSSTVRIVFHALNDGRNAILVTAEIDHTVVLLVTTTDMTGGDTTVVITATSLGFLFQQRCVGSAFVQLLIHHFDDKATTSGSRFAFNDCHDAPLYSAPAAKSRSWPGWRAMYAFFQSLRLPRPRTVRLVLPFTLRVVT